MEAKKSQQIKRGNIILIILIFFVVLLHKNKNHCLCHLRMSCLCLQRVHVLFHGGRHVAAPCSPNTGFRNGLSQVFANFIATVDSPTGFESEGQMRCLESASSQLDAAKSYTLVL